MKTYRDFKDQNVTIKLAIPIADLELEEKGKSYNFKNSKYKSIFGNCIGLSRKAVEEVGDEYVVHTLDYHFQDIVEAYNFIKECNADIDFSKVITLKFNKLGDTYIVDAVNI